MEFEPYRPPDDDESRDRAPGGRPGVKPRVWQWYLAYCFFMAFLYLVIAVAFGVALPFAEEIAEESDDVDAMELKIQAIVMLVVCIPLLFLYGAAPFLPKTKLAWIWGFVTIGIGLTSICCLPFTIPLLIFWLKPETKAFFGVGS